MTSSVYSAGTASVSNGSAIVAGTGAAWKIALVTGGMFSFAGYSVPIASVESDTSLTLAYPWPGAAASGGYAIARETSEAVRAAWINDRLAQILTKLSLAGVHPDGAGTLAERNALSPQPAAGFLWLRVETGFDLVFYKRTASGWEGPFSLKGNDGQAGPAGVLNWIEAGWATEQAYAFNAGLTHSGTSFRCYVGHVSGAATEPGVGANWQTVWKVTAAAGAKGDKGDKGADGSGTGDMVKATYDPNNKAADAFGMANMVEGADAKVMTAAERLKLGNMAATVGAAVAGTSQVSSPADGDRFAGVSAGGSTLFWTTFGNIKAGLKSYFDGLYATLGAVALKLDASALDTARQWTTRQRSTTVPLTSSAAISVNLAVGQNFDIAALAHAATLTFTNAASAVEQKGSITGKNDASAGRTLAYGAGANPVGSATAPTIPSGANARWRIDYHVRADATVDFSVASVGV